MSSDLDWKKNVYRTFALLGCSEQHPLWTFSHRNILTVNHDSWSIQSHFFFLCVLPTCRLFWHTSKWFIARSLCIAVLTILGFTFSSKAIFGMDFVGSFAVLVNEIYICFLLTLTIAHDYGLVYIVDSVQEHTNSIFVWSKLYALWCLSFCEAIFHNILEK